MSGLLPIVAALGLIAVLITIHEFGHFIVAKLFKVDVRVFSIGMGKRLFGVTWRGTDYRVSMLPLGGYVRMAGADPFSESGRDDVDEDGVSNDSSAVGAFLAKPAWQRLLIMAAGPAMNLALPFFVFTVLLVAGEPQPDAVVGTVREGTPAASAGIQAEDRIVSVAGTPVATWVDVSEAFETAPHAVPLVVRDREGVERSVVLAAPRTPAADPGDGRDPWDYGLRLVAPDPHVSVDDPASPAAKAGLTSGDVLLAVGDTPVANWNEVTRLLASPTTPVRLRWRAGEGDEATERTAVLQPDPGWEARAASTATTADDATWRAWGLANADTTVGSYAKDASAGRKAGMEMLDRVLLVNGVSMRRWSDLLTEISNAADGAGETMKARPVTITVRRDGVVKELTVTPDVVRDTNVYGRYRWRPRIGIGSLGDIAEPPKVRRPYPLPQAFERANRETVLIARMMVTQLGKMFTNEAPLSENLGGPIEFFRQSKAAAERGIFDWARQLGVFSISLGIINLLPVPVLDGGQIVMYAAEWLRGRPLPLNVRERLQQVGVLFLVSLMLFAFVNDSIRAFWR